MGTGWPRIIRLLQQCRQQSDPLDADPGATAMIRDTLSVIALFVIAFGLCAIGYGI